MPETYARAFLIFSGFNLRGVVAFCRALQQDGRRFHIVACTEADPIFSTNWKRAVIAVRQQTALDTDDLARCVNLATISTGIKDWVVAPTSEFFVRWCLDHRAQLATWGCKLPVVDGKLYATISDKRSFAAICRAAGLRVPLEVSGTEVIPLPCVAKPIRNITAAGRTIYPWLLRSSTDVARFNACCQPADYFFQEWVEGTSIYLLLFIGEAGEVVRFSQRNLAQQPEGKSIVWAEAADFHQSQEADRWVKMLQALSFTGLIMIELRIQPNGTATLIEANPRLWGPLQLTVDLCPGLIRAFIATALGPSQASPPAVIPPRRNYLWIAGARCNPAGTDLAWHGPRPRWPWLTFMRQLRSDVFFHRDSWRLFWRELITRKPASLN